MKNKKIMEAKIVMVGDVSVGKSSLTVRYVYDKFDQKMQSTLGAAYMEKIQQINEKSIKLKIWDTAGQQKYKAIAKLYYKDSQVAIVIYDVTRRQTFENVKVWIQQLKKHAPKNIIFVIVANKIDLLKQQQFPSSQITKTQQGKQFAKSIGASFYEVSAKNKEGVCQLFQQVSQDVIALVQKSTLSTKESNGKSFVKLSKSSIIGDENVGKRKKCCET